QRTAVVTGLYIHLLRRAGSPAEIGGWVGSGLDQFHIRTGIEASGEHGALVNSTSADFFSGPPSDLVNGRPPTFASPHAINDLYVFRSPANANNTVLILTFQAFAGALTPATADPSQTYDIHINNTNPLDGSDNLDFQVTYGAADANGVQSVALRGRPSVNFPPNGLLAPGQR